MKAYPAPQILWQCHGHATLTGIRGLRQELAIVLAAQGLEGEYLQNLLLGMSELMTNVVRHAKPSAHRIHLTLHLQQGTIWLELEDDGGAFDPGRREPGLFRGLHHDTRLRVSGYGLELMRLNLPSLRYQRTAGSNRYSMPLAA